MDVKFKTRWWGFCCGTWKYVAIKYHEGVFAEYDYHVIKKQWKKVPGLINTEDLSMVAG